MNPTPEKKEIGESWTTEWKKIQLKIAEVFGEETTVPELSWTMDLDVKPGPNGLEHEMTEDAKPPHGQENIWVPESHYYEWFFAKQENILSKKLGEVRLEVARQDNFVTASKERKLEVLDGRSTDSTEREGKNKRLQFLKAERSKLGKRREDLRDPGKLDDWDAFTDLIDPLELEVREIDSRQVTVGRFEQESKGKLMVEWYADADEMSDTNNLKMVDIDDVIKKAELKRNIIQKTKVDKIKDQLSVTTAAKELWQSKANDYREATE